MYSRGRDKECKQNFNCEIFWENTGKNKVKLELRETAAITQNIYFV